MASATVQCERGAHTVRLVAVDQHIVRRRRQQIHTYTRPIPVAIDSDIARI